MKLERALLVVMVGGWLALTLAREAFDGEPDNPNAGLQTAAVVEGLRADGWVVEPAEEHRALEMMLIEKEDSIDRLSVKLAAAAEDAQLHGAELRAVTELAFEASTALRLSGQAFGTDTLLVPQLVPDSVTFDFDDGIFSGRAIHYPRDNQLALGIYARFGAAMTITEAPDGQVLFGAIADDPRISMQMRMAVWAPPPPVVRCSLGQRATSAAVGSLVTLGGIAAWVMH